jgi:hypothetical protein
MARVTAAARPNDAVLAVSRVVKEPHPAPSTARELPERRSNQVCHPDKIVLLQPPDLPERGSVAFFLGSGA